MHQPEYRVDGLFRRPWAYLHALSAYTDMAEQLELATGMRTVVNFTPVLLDQLDDYARRLHRWQQSGTPIGDALLDALAEPPLDATARTGVVRDCLTAMDSRRARDCPRYQALAAAAAACAPGQLPDRLFVDLLVWFHLLWLGQSVRQGDPRAQVLADKGGGFDAVDRRGLLALIADVVVAVIPRWRALADSGRVELSMSPYYHPLVPLLLDFGSARERAPATVLPAVPYPEGEQRVRWQLAEGLRCFDRVLGRRPAGCWPPEAALSEATLRVFAGAGFAWTASSHSLLEATLAHHAVPVRSPFRLFRHAGSGICCGFRDDGLSDRIGFEYQHWQSADAVADLLARLEAISREPGHDLVLIALDGENPWEFYPDNGVSFLRGLFAGLCNHATLQPATLSDCLRELSGSAAALPPVLAGSWVQGELLTWVGHPEKNRAWELLIEARRRQLSLRRSEPALLHRLGACEGSDWFWWPGASNPAASVADFDELFRAQLAALYAELGHPPPESLSRPFAAGVEHAVAAGGTMLPSAHP
jgi:alpha-amylase/alpha-mannosidase (GH57 family)